jgi:hypothetical protein
VDRATAATVLTGEDGDRFDVILRNVHLSDSAAHDAGELVAVRRSRQSMHHSRSVT